MLPCLCFIYFSLCLHWVFFCVVCSVCQSCRLVSRAKRPISCFYKNNEYFSFHRKCNSRFLNTSTSVKWDMFLSCLSPVETVKCEPWEMERLYLLCAPPRWVVWTPHSGIILKTVSSVKMCFGLKRLAHCVWDGWILIAAQCQCEKHCLEWMLPPLLISSSISISVLGFPPELRSNSPSLLRLQPFFLPKRWHRSHTSTLSSPAFPYPHYSSAVHIRLSRQFVFLVLFNLDILLQARQEKSQVAVRKTERGQDGSPESMSARHRTVQHPKQLQCKLLTYLK